MATKFTILDRLTTLEKRDSKKTAEILSIQEAMEASEKEKHALNMKIESLNDDVSAVKEKNKLLKMIEIPRLREENKHLIKENEKLISQHSLIIDSIHDDISEMKVNIQNLEKKNETLTRENATLKTNLSSGISQINSVQGNMSNMKEKIGRLEKTEIPKLINSKDNTLAQKIDSIQDDINAIKTKIKHLESVKIPQLLHDDKRLLQENDRMKLLMNSVRTDIDGLTSSLSDVREKINDKKLEEQINNLNGIRRCLNKTLIDSHIMLEKEKKLSLIPVLESRINDLIKRMDSGTEYDEQLKSRVDDLESRVAIIPELEGDIFTLTSCVQSGQDYDFKKSERQHSSLDNMDTKIKDLIGRVGNYIDRFDQIGQSITCVRLQASLELTTGHLIKLGNCTQVHTNNGYFDRDSASLDPQQDGTYALNVWFQQQGCGEIAIYRGEDDIDDTSICLGKTHSDGDIGSCLLLLKLKKREKVCLEAIRIKGNASIGQCILFSWLVC